MIELPSQEKIRTLREKKTNKHLGILEVDIIKKAEIKKNKNKRATQTKENAFRNQALQQESHQSDKYLGCFSCKILRTILEMEKRKITKMDLRTRKLMMMRKVLHP